MSAADRLPPSSFPSPETLRPIEAAAVAIAHDAGSLLLDRFRTVLDVQFKDDHGHDPVTEVDKAVEEMVQLRVGRDFPDHAILGEEGASHGPLGADFVWAIDPLDGTTNFINGLAIFSSSIGVLWRGAPVAGALFLPGGGALGAGVYHCRRGGGAFFNADPLRFRPTSLPPGSRISSVPAGVGGVVGPSGRRRFGTARTLGSSAAELALTAEGTFQAGVFGGLKIWDVAAGSALCLEAGAAVWVRGSGAGDWRPLEHFRGGPHRAPSLGELLGWSDRLAAGAPGMLPDLPRDLQREQKRLSVLRRLLFGSGEE